MMIRMSKVAPAPEFEGFARVVGQRLQAARIAKGLSQERVAHLAGIAGFTYQKFEKGESRPGTPMNPRLTTLIALCQVLDLSLEKLLAGPWPDLRYRP